MKLWGTAIALGSLEQWVCVCVQETVRKAADMACTSLHKVTVSACDVTTNSSTGELGRGVSSE